jgi:hypothetical protein
MKTYLSLSLVALLSMSSVSYASGTLSVDEAKNIKRQQDFNEIQKQQLSVIAGLLAEYEIEAKKLVSSLDEATLTAESVGKRADKLIDLSESVLLMARFRLPQCDAYLSQAVGLKDKLETISNEKLEADYHLDAALPQAPAECYHTKDLFVHPATVKVLTRDDPNLNSDTRTSINAEITEVLAHIEIVRELVLY